VTSLATPLFPGNHIFPWLALLGRLHFHPIGVEGRVVSIP
jgi:hypothetical protein